MNNYRFWGIVAGLSTFTFIIGNWAKVTHQSYGNRLFTTGSWALAVSAGVYVYLKFISLKKD